MAYNNFYSPRDAYRKNSNKFFYGIKGSGKYLENPTYPFRWTPHKGEAVLISSFGTARSLNKKFQNTQIVLIRIDNKGANNGTKG